MKCPNCQTENKTGAKFCVGCGTKLASLQPAPMDERTEIVSFNPMSSQEDDERTVVDFDAANYHSYSAGNSNMNQNVCSCGATLNPGAKFCRVCGKVQSPIPGIQGADATVSPSMPAANQIPPVQPVRPVPPAQPVMPAVPPVMPAVPPVQPVKPKGSAHSGKKKSNGPLIAVLIILSIITILIVVLLGKVVFTMKDESCSFSEAIDYLLDNKSDGNRKDDDKDEKEDEEGKDEENEEEDIVVAVTEEDLKPANDLAETGREQIDNGEYDTGYTTLDNALDMYGNLYIKFEGSEESLEAIQESCNTTFEVYKAGVYARGDQMLSQSLQKGLFTQINTDAGRAYARAEKMQADYGITLEVSDLDEFITQAKDSLRQRYIAEYDALCAEWSRTTAWNLADAAESDGLFEKDDLDDPLRLRWCYAYAGMTRKEVEEDLSGGKITAVQAAQTLESIIAECDYNPALILDCANKYANAGQNADRLFAAYNVVHDTIHSNQGLDIGRDVSLDKEPGKEQFWYFNDFVTDSQISSYNGVSASTRQAIRSSISL